MGRSTTTETLYAVTDGASTTGTLAVQSYLTETTLAGSTPETYTSLSIPKGVRAKIWIEKISGAICTVNAFFNANPTAATSTSYTMPTNASVQTDSTYLVSAGVLKLDDRRPLIVEGYDVGTAVANLVFKWVQTVAAVSNIVIKIEWSLATTEY